MASSDGVAVPRVDVGSLRLCRILNGMWQMSGGHGKFTNEAAVEAMKDHVDAGLTSFDGADHYGPAETLLADLATAYPEAEFEALTKWVPRGGEMTREVVEDAIRVSLGRMNVEVLDMLQFHWWDYSDENWLAACRHLADLQTDGLIREVALTNFDTETTRRIIEDAGCPIASNQVSLSLVDRRAIDGPMAGLAREHGFKLLCYGTLLGGWLTDKYLGAAAPSSRADMPTSSLQKYWRFIQRFGGWDLFQELLQVLRAVADKHDVDIANVAVKWVLDHDDVVACAIVGVRFGTTAHIESNLRTFGLTLDDDDRSSIAAVLERSTALPGDCGDEYRR